LALLNAYYHCWKGTGDCPGITQPNALPVIDGFVADKTSGKVPLTVRFECTARDPDGAIADYRWDFDGNGLTDSVTTQGIIDYTYNTMGTYAASCTVTDNEGAAAPSSAITITISRTKSGTIRK
jgi:PKD repeat protein